MNAFDELKLKVYESGLDWDEKETIIDLMESCDEDEVQEVCESVEAFVTEANTYNKLANKYKNEYEGKIWKKAKFMEKKSREKASEIAKKKSRDKTQQVIDRSDDL